MVAFNFASNAEAREVKVLVDAKLQAKRRREGKSILLLLYLEWFFFQNFKIYTYYNTR